MARCNGASWCDVLETYCSEGLITMCGYAVEGDIFPFERSDDKDEERCVSKCQTIYSALFAWQAFVVCGLHPCARAVIPDILFGSPISSRLPV
jgi:hypothetical protein